MLDFHENPLSETELEQKKGKLNKCLLVVRHREFPFAEDFIANGAGAVDPELPKLASKFRFMDVLKIGASYKLVEKLWAQFVLTNGGVIVEVVWTRVEVVVSSITFPESLRNIPG